MRHDTQKHLRNITSRSWKSKRIKLLLQKRTTKAFSKRSLSRKIHMKSSTLQESMINEPGSTADAIENGDFEAEETIQQSVEAGEQEQVKDAPEDKNVENNDLLHIPGMDFSVNLESSLSMLSAVPEVDDNAVSNMGVSILGHVEATGEGQSEPREMPAIASL